MDRRLIGAQLALTLGTSGLLGGFANIGNGDPPGSTALLASPIMILGAAAYASRKRRLLGSRRRSTLRLTFEGACLALITTMWLGFPDIGKPVIATVWLGFTDLPTAVETDPAPLLLVPLWALLAYPFAGLRMKREPVDDAPPVAGPSWIRTTLWSVPVTIALCIGAAAATAGVLAASFHPTPVADLWPSPTPEDLAVLAGARTLRCALDNFEDEQVITDINLDTGTARLIGNVGSAPATVVAGLEMLSFIEVTPVGAVNTITVYAYRTTDYRFTAVTSRHTAVAGPSPSQALGSCTVLLD